MSSIAVVSEYTPVEKALSVHAKNWAVKPKPEPLHVDRHVKGPCRVKFKDHTLKSPLKQEFDNPEEMLRGLREENARKLQAYRYPDQEKFTNVEKQSQGGMWSAELVRRIQKLNPKLIVQDSKNVPGCAGFYKMVDDELTFTNASFRHGFVPQHTIMREDRNGLATEFTYGWSTVLMRLLKTGDLKWNQVCREFGYIADDRAKQWAAHTSEFRT